eukprot:14034457-Heterocapsa_arctica.AAC.1
MILHIPYRNVSTTYLTRRSSHGTSSRTLTTSSLQSKVCETSSWRHVPHGLSWCLTWPWAPSRAISQITCSQQYSNISVVHCKRIHLLGCPGSSPPLGGRPLAGGGDAPAPDRGR